MPVELLTDVPMRLQGFLADPSVSGRLQAADRRELTTLLWPNLNPYGEIQLDMTCRLGLPHATRAAGG